MRNFIVNWPVMIGAVGIIAVFLAIGTFLPSQSEVFFSRLQSSILDNFGWFYMLAVGAIFASVLVFGMSRFGSLKLGPDDAEPDFSYISWLAMLFAAGMGIGLMFYGVGEPMSHFANPPEAEPLTIAAQREAMVSTFFHWGLHGWAIYAVVGLALAYFGYRYNLPLTIRSGLYPLLKERINGPIGHAVDIFAIVGTLFGIATSLGLGVMQINAGLGFLLGVPLSVTVQVILIFAVMAVAAVSAVTGVDKGVRILSEINLSVAVLLMLFVLVVGSTATVLGDFAQNLGMYLDKFLLLTFNVYAYEPRQWFQDWTLFYWAWWISWSPFVGMFIARISRGRTVREFLVGVLLVPSGFTFLWMTVFGNTAMLIDTTVAAGALTEAVASDLSIALFQFFQYLPFPAVTSTLAIILVAVFFVTSADSGSLVIDTIAAGGETETPALQRLFWCALQAVVAAVLLLAGGLDALQSATIASALPFIFVILALIVSLFRGMSSDVAQRQAFRSMPQAQPAAGVTWQRRLGLILKSPTSRDIETFLTGTVTPALEAVAEELTKRGRAAEVTRDAETGAVSLTSAAEGMRDFVYGVYRAEHKLAAFTTLDATKLASRFEARTFFADGSRGYDVMGLTKDQVISDVLVQFERYLAVAQSPQSQLVTSAPEHPVEVVST